MEPNNFHYDWTGKKIIIADNSEFSYQFTFTLLEQTNCTQIWIKNGLDLITFCKENNFISLILIETRLPLFNGIEATKIIKLINPQIPIIAYTVHDDKDSFIKAESYPELNRFAAFLKINKKIEIEISGHTDNDGKSEDLLNLSISRAQAVADYLSENKIDGKRFSIVGFGDQQPIGFNKTEDGREMNRRIEFKITSLTRIKKK